MTYNFIEWCPWNLESNISQGEFWLKSNFKNFHNFIHKVTAIRM